MNRSATKMLLFLTVFCVVFCATPILAASDRVLLSRAGSGSIDAETLALLPPLGARSLQEYPAFLLVDVPTQNTDRLTALAAQHGLTIERLQNADVVELPRATIHTGSRPSFQRSTYAGPGLYVVQYVGPPTATWLDLGSRGISVVQGLQHNSVIVAGSPEAVRAWCAHDSTVQWSDEYDPSTKFARFDAASGPTDLIVQIAKVSGREGVRAHIAALTDGPLREQEVGPDYLIHAKLTGAQASNLLNDPLVIGIDREPRFLPSDERQALSATASGGSTPAGSYLSWLGNSCGFCSNLLTEGFRVGYADSGLDYGSGAGGAYPQHADLAGRELFGTSFMTDSCLPGDSDCDRYGHGTMLAGILVGNGSSGATDTGGYKLGVGVAPSAGVVSTKIFNLALASSGSIFDWANDAVRNGAYVQNHSYNDYGTNTSGQYTTTSRNYDLAVRDADGNWGNGVSPITLTVSAGNIHSSSGETYPTMVLAPATAKNVIAVGAAENYRPDTDGAACYSTAADSYNNVSADSKRGMINSSIFKPDLVAPGTMITSAKTGNLTFPPPAWCDLSPYGSTVHIMDSGTSFAAPAAAGAALLASRMYSASPGAASPSLLKAMLVAGGRSMVGGVDKYSGLSVSARPNNTIGFGLLQLAPLFSSLGNQYVNETTSFSSSGQSWSYYYYAVDQNQPVTVVLAWSDAPALAGATNTLVNDLDLRVDALYPVSPPICSRSYSGNQLGTSETSNAYNCAGSVPTDTNNNVEVVRFTPGNVNLFKVTVRATSLGGQAIPNGTNPSQDFSLYVINGRDGSPTAP